jgi:C4-type Zn-finger protein
VCELLGGVTSFSTYSYTTKRGRIIEELTNLKQKIIESGKKSIVIDNVELVEFFKGNDLEAVSDYVKGLRRVGNRLSIHEKVERTEFKKRDVQLLIGACINTVNSQVKFTLDLKYVHEDYVKAVELVKKLVTFEQVMEYADKDEWNRYDETKHFFKDIWDNPEKILDL